MKICTAVLENDDPILMNGLPIDLSAGGNRVWESSHGKGGFMVMLQKEKRAMSKFELFCMIAFILNAERDETGKDL